MMITCEEKRAERGLRMRMKIWVEGHHHSSLDVSEYEASLRMILAIPTRVGYRH